MWESYKNYSKEAGVTYDDNIVLESIEETHRIAFDRIKRFYPDDKIAACACLWDQTGGGYRTVPIKFLFLDKKKAKDSRQDFLSFWDSFKG